MENLGNDNVKLISITKIRSDIKTSVKILLNI